MTIQSAEPSRLAELRALAEYVRNIATWAAHRKSTSIQFLRWCNEEGGDLFPELERDAIAKVMALPTSQWRQQVLAIDTALSKTTRRRGAGRQSIFQQHVVTIADYFHLDAEDSRIFTLAAHCSPWMIASMPCRRPSRT